jgi:hypothetical protein
MEMMDRGTKAGFGSKDKSSKQWTLGQVEELGFEVRAYTLSHSASPIM